MRTLSIIFILTLAGITGVFAQGFEKSEFEASSGDKLRYALLKPIKVEAGKKYPLVIALHGAAGRGAKNWLRNSAANAALGKPEMREKFPCYVIAPVTEKSETWRKVGSLAGKERLSDVFELIDHLLKDLPIDRKRIYVTGQSMGGAGTYAAIAARPDFFAAAVPVCGRHKVEDAKIFVNTPIWIFHGAKDKTVDVKNSREMIEALKKAGGSPKYTEYPKAGHNSWTPAYNTDELWKWMFEQRQQNR